MKGSACICYSQRILIGVAGRKLILMEYHWLLRPWLSHLRAARCTGVWAEFWSIHCVAQFNRSWFHQWGGAEGSSRKWPTGSFKSPWHKWLHLISPFSRAAVAVIAALLWTLSSLRLTGPLDLWWWAIRFLTGPSPLSPKALILLPDGLALSLSLYSVISLCFCLLLLGGKKKAWSIITEN